MECAPPNGANALQVSSFRVPCPVAASGRKRDKKEERRKERGKEGSERRKPGGAGAAAAGGEGAARQSELAQLGARCGQDWAAWQAPGAVREGACRPAER